MHALAKITNSWWLYINLSFSFPFSFLAGSIKIFCINLDTYDIEDGEVIDLTGEEEAIEDPEYEKVILYRHKTTGYYYNPVSDTHW